MTDPKEQGKPTVRTREPKKKSPGIFDNLRPLHPHPVEEILGLAQGTMNPTPSTGSTPSTTPTPSTGSTPSTPSRQSRKSAISPERDYTKVANSIIRQAVPLGIFGEQGGKSKELYDALYLLTRGAVAPRRKVRIPKDQLMRKAGIGSDVTLKKNLNRLKSASLIKETIVPGAHGGNEYEVFLPEEVGLTGATPSTPSTGSSSPQMLEGLPPLESRGSTPCLSDALSTTSGEDKTISFKTWERTDDDDAALAGLLSILKKTAEEVTGREVTSGERERWSELGEVLATELKIAAARTTVSSAPSFLAEHLRRRLWKKDKRELQAEATIATPLAGKSSTLTAEQIKACPECGGTGFKYKGENFTGGVEKCQHEKVATGDELA